MLEDAAVPWCVECERFLSPSTVNRDGSCPTCGKPVDTGSGSARRLGRVPWHLKVLIVVFALYLTYRIAQGVEWLIGEI
jgi:predicted RNA-binding Zn-ribbon protein involved in translation (DUF1610 family)